MTTYNYYCINDNCSNKKNIHIKQKPNELTTHHCPDCNNELKLLGIVTNIYHIGTQESLNKNNR